MVRLCRFLFWSTHTVMIVGTIMFWPYFHTGFPEGAFWLVVETIVLCFVLPAIYGGWAYSFFVGFTWGRIRRGKPRCTTYWMMGIVALLLGTNSTAVTHFNASMAPYHLTDFYSNLAWAAVTFMIGGLLGTLPYRRKVTGNNEGAVR